MIKVKEFRLSNGISYRTAWTTDSKGMISVKYIYKSLIFPVVPGEFQHLKELEEAIKKADA